MRNTPDKIHLIVSENDNGKIPTDFNNCEHEFTYWGQGHDKDATLNFISQNKVEKLKSQVRNALEELGVKDQLNVNRKINVYNKLMRLLKPNI